MRESTPGLQNNISNPENSASVFNSESTDVHSQTNQPVSEGQFENNGNHQQSNQQDVDSNSGSEDTNNKSDNSADESIHSSGNSEDHSSDEDFEPSERRRPSSNPIPGEPGPLIQQNLPHQHTNQQRLPQLLNNTTATPPTSLPNLAAYGDSDWPGLHSPNPNPFLFQSAPRNTQQQRQSHQQQQQQQTATNQPFMPHPPPLNGNPQIPNLQFPPNNASQDSFGRLSAQLSAPSAIQPRLPASQGQPAMYQLQDSMRRTDNTIQQLPLPIIRPLSHSAGHHHNSHSRSSSAYTSDSESTSSLQPSEQGDPPSRGHRPSSSINFGASSSSNSLAQLHDPRILRQFPSICSVMTSDRSQPGQERPTQYEDAAGRMATDMWKDEGTVCLVVKLRGIAVTRRCDNNMINGTKLLNSARISRGRRDGMLKAERIRHVVRVGGMDYKGVWVPFERAMDMAKQENVLDMLYPLFLADLRQIFRIPENFSRLMQVIRGSRINAQFSMWLSSINSPATYRPGYHFYPPLPNPYSQDQVISFDDEIEGPQINDQGNYYQQQQQLQDTHTDSNRPNRSELQLGPIGSENIPSTVVKPELDQPYDSFHPPPNSSNSSNFGIRQFNLEEFMQPPMQQYTAYLKYAYQSFEPRRRENRYYVSEDDDTDMDMDYD